MVRAPRAGVGSICRKCPLTTGSTRSRGPHMKRVLVAGVLGGLLLLGTPTLASSAEKEDRRSEKSDKSDRHDRDDRRDRDGKDRHHRDSDRYRHRHGYYYGDHYYGGYR